MTSLAGCVLIYPPEPGFVCGPCDHSCREDSAWTTYRRTIEKTRISPPFERLDDVRAIRISWGEWVGVSPSPSICIVTHRNLVTLFLNSSPTTTTTMPYFFRSCHYLNVPCAHSFSHELPADSDSRFTGTDPRLPRLCRLLIKASTLTAMDRCSASYGC